MIYALNHDRFVGKPIHHFKTDDPYNTDDNPVIGFISAITVNQDLLSDDYLYGDVVLWDDKYPDLCDVNEFANYGISDFEWENKDGVDVVSNFKPDWISLK